MDKFHFTIGIRAVTPLHFGSGDTYVRGFDFIGKRFINVNGMMQHFKQKPHFLQKMAIAIEEKKFEEFIEQNRKEIPDKFFKPMDVAEEPRSVRVHIKNGFGQAYIPGSAIKGSIRTSIIKCLSGETDMKILIQKTLSNVRFKVKDADNKISGTLLTNHPKSDAKYNLMKAMHVSDSEQIMNSLKIKKIEIKNTSKGPLYAEVIPTKTQSSFTMNLDAFFLDPENHKKLFGDVKYDFSKLIGDLNETTVKILSYHEKYSGKNNLKAYNFLIEILQKLKGSEALIDLGYGIGWVGMTGNLVGGYYNTLDSRGKEQLKKTLRLNPSKHSTDYFPITRRFIKEEGRTIPMGWAVLSFPDEYFKSDWTYSGIPECADFIDNIEGTVYTVKKEKQNALIVGSTYSAKIVFINDEKKFADAVVKGIRGRIWVREIADAFIKDIRDYLWEDKEVRIKVLAFNNGKYDFSCKQAE